MPQAGDSLTVGYWDSGMQKYTPIKQAQAWNRHNGCRFQWVGDTDKYFIFNNLVNGYVGSNAYSVNGSLVKTLDYPIDIVFPSGGYATSFSYERLNRYIPGYGYIQIIYSLKRKFLPVTGFFLSI